MSHRLDCPNPPWFPPRVKPGVASNQSDRSTCHWQVAQTVLWHPVFTGGAGDQRRPAPAGALPLARLCRTASDPRPCQRPVTPAQSFGRPPPPKRFLCRNRCETCSGFGAEFGQTPAGPTAGFATTSVAIGHAGRPPPWLHNPLLPTALAHGPEPQPSRSLRTFRADFTEDPSDTGHLTGFVRDTRRGSCPARPPCG